MLCECNKYLVLVHPVRLQDRKHRQADRGDETSDKRTSATPAADMRATSTSACLPGPALLVLHGVQ